MLHMSCQAELAEGGRQHWTALCGAAQYVLVRYLSSPDVYHLHCSAREVAGSFNCRCALRHIHLGKSSQDGRDAAVLDLAPWEEIESVSAVHTSLYAVHEGLVRANLLTQLEVELQFPEPFAELLPLACVRALRRLVLRCCYMEVLESFARALRCQRLPCLEELCLERSPKHAAAQQQGLRWPPRRLGLPAETPGASTAIELVEALVEQPRVAALRMDHLALFHPLEIEPVLARLAKGRSFRQLRLTNLSCLGHQALISLLDGLAADSPHLESLDLAPTALSAADFEQPQGLGEALTALLVATAANLRTLRLASCALGAEGLAVVAEALAHRYVAAQQQQQQQQQAEFLLFNLRVMDLSDSGRTLEASVLNKLLSALTMLAPRLQDVCFLGWLSGSDDCEVLQDAVQSACEALPTGQVPRVVL
eukprot:TRINITY_DN19380_c0_g1_i1.p1 TRINITY_DN19380_c0_g1~~TRINITY_DN19380_c0_g1_i1.p1  ORF type:complete len:423 (-),score=98.05 TRINITY_DN19380_c0_g1_i1:316-1584(-)